MALHVAFLARLLVYDDLAAAYPFAGGDTFDYLRGALAINGADLDTTGRPPLLPLTMALLDRAGALGWLPVLFVLVHQAFALLVFAEWIATSRAAAWTAWGILALGSAGLRWAIHLEPALAGSWLLAASVLVLAGRWSGSRMAPCASGLLAGAAYLAHQLALIYPAVAGVAALLGRRRGAAVAALWFLPFPAGWLAYRYWAFSRLGDAGVLHWGLVDWHADAVVPYLVMGLALFGVPLTVTALVGLARGLRERDVTVRLTAASAAGALVFFVFFYDYAAQRFLLYVLPFAVFLAAYAVAALGSRRLAAVLGVLLVTTAALPRSAADRQTAIALLPGVDVKTEIDLTPRAPGRLEGVRLASRPPAVLGESSLYRRLLRASRRSPPPAPRPPRSQTAADLYVLAPGEVNTLARRSRVQVLLARRVHLVPPALVEPLLCALAPRPAGDFAGITVWRTTLPDGRATTISHRRGWRPLDELDAGVCPGIPDDLPAAAAALGADWSRRQLGLVVAAPDPLVALALFSIRGELIVPPPWQPATRRLLRRAPAGKSDFSITIDGISWRVVAYPGEVEQPRR